MKKIFFSVMAILMAGSMLAENAAMPETVPGKPNMDASKVQAVMCDFYANNFGFTPQSWGKAAAPDTLGQTHMFYYSQASWDALTNWGQSSYDASGFAKLHLDVWVNEATPQIKIKIEALSTGDGGSGYSSSYVYPTGLMQGWNALDIDLATAYAGYDFKDLRYVIFEGLQDETKPLSLANILFYNGTYTADEPEKVKREEKTPADAPTALADDVVPSNAQAIFSNGFKESLGFASVDWGCPWKEYKVKDDNTILYTANMTWEAFTNWGSDCYDLSAYDRLVVELFSAEDAEIKITIEALKEAEGGQEGDFKNGVVKKLDKGIWNIFDISYDFFVYPADTTKSYNFKDLKYIILEGYSKEGTMLTIGRVYVYKSETGLIATKNESTKAIKRMVNGQLVIERNGVQYNALGSEL